MLRPHVASHFNVEQKSEYKLNSILGIPPERFRVCRRIGYGARNTVYEVIRPSGMHAAMKYLVQNSEENRNRLKFEYELLQRLKRAKLS